MRRQLKAFHLDSEVLAAYKKHSAETGIPQAELMRRALAAYLSTLTKQTPRMVRA